MVELVELKAGGPALLGAGRVLPAATAGAVMGIETLRAEAEREAAALVAAARAEADSIRQAAHRAGMEAAESEIQDRLFDIAEASVSVMERTEGRIVDLALQVARRVIGSLDEGDVVARMATRALKLAAHSSFVRLRVAPVAVDAVRERLDRLPGDGVASVVVEVIPDARLREGGCVLETDAGLIDASLESQMAAIERGLRRSFGRGEPAEA